MPKLRNASTDLGGLTQWIARKCRNHNPLAEVTMQAHTRAKKASTYRHRQPDAKELRVAGKQENVVLYSQGGRTFAIKVLELTDQPELIETLEAEGVVAVGH